jgi:hypothetical protein
LPAIYAEGRFTGHGDAKGVSRDLFERLASDAFYQAYVDHKTAIPALMTVEEVLGYEVKDGWPDTAGE